MLVCDKCGRVGTKSTDFGYAPGNKRTYKYMSFDKRQAEAVFFCSRIKITSVVHDEFLGHLCGGHVREVSSEDEYEKIIRRVGDVG